MPFHIIHPAHLFPWLQTFSDPQVNSNNYSSFLWRNSSKSLISQSRYSHSLIINAASIRWNSSLQYRLKFPRCKSKSLHILVLLIPRSESSSMMRICRYFIITSLLFRYSIYNSFSLEYFLYRQDLYKYYIIKQYLNK